MLKAFATLIAATSISATPLNFQNSIDPFTIAAQIHDESTSQPCITISLTNRYSAEAGAPPLVYPWEHTILYIVQNGHRLAPTGAGIEMIDRHGMIARNVKPGETVQMTDGVAQDAKHKTCILLSRWGFASLAPGNYRLRVAVIQFMDRTQRSDIDETRGLRSALITFRKS